MRGRSLIRRRRPAPGTSRVSVPSAGPAQPRPRLVRELDTVRQGKSSARDAHPPVHRSCALFRIRRGPGRASPPWLPRGRGGVFCSTPAVPASGARPGRGGWRAPGDRSRQGSGRGDKATPPPRLPGTTQAVVVVPVARIVPVAVRNPQVPRVVVPRPAAQHPSRQTALLTKTHSEKIRCRSLQVSP